MKNIFLILFISFPCFCFSQNSIVDVKNMFGVGYVFNQNANNLILKQSEGNTKIYNVATSKRVFGVYPAETEISVVNGLLQFVRLTFSGSDGVIVGSNILYALNDLPLSGRSKNYVYSLWQDNNISVCGLMYGAKEYNLLIFDNQIFPISF